MNRQESLELTFNHPYLKKGFLRLSKDEIAFCLNFIKENENSDPDTFEFKINRIFMDKAEKSKNWKIITELLSASNSLFKMKGLK